MGKINFIEKAAENIDIESENLIEQILEISSLSSERQKEEARVLLSQGVNEFKQSFIRGYELVLNHAAQNKFGIPRENFELKPLDKKSHPEAAHESSDLKNKFLQEIFGYTPRMLREIYEFGCQLFHQKEFGKCADVLIFLIVLNPTLCWFWQVLGRAWEAQEKNEEALYAFTVAINCDLHRIEGYQDAVRCCVKMKDYKNAQSILDYGLEAIKNDSDVSLESGLKSMKAYIKKLGG